MNRENIAKIVHTERGETKGKPEKQRMERDKAGRQAGR